MSMVTYMPLYDPDRDYYAILALRDTATPAEIKAAYRSLMRGAHPDVNADRPEAKTWAQDLNAAYDVLSNTAARAEYDLLRVQYKAVKAKAAPASEAKTATGGTAKAATTQQQPPHTAPPRAAPGKQGPSTGDILGGVLLGLGAIAVIGGIGAAVASAFDED